MSEDGAKKTAQAKAAEEEEDNNSTFCYDGIPEEKAWFLSQLFYLWERPLFQRASSLHKQGRALEQDDLLPLPTCDTAHTIGPIFEQAWKELESEYGPATVARLEDLKGDVDQSTSRLRRSLLKVMGRRFYVAGVIKAINTALQFGFPLLLNNILKFIEDTQNGIILETDPWQVRYRGYWLSAILFVAMGSKAVTENAYFHRVVRAGYQAKVAVSMAVYQKSLRLTNAERQSTTLGELVNLMQVDASKIEMFVPQIHVLWDGIFQIVGYMAILYSLIGWPCFAGLVIMVVAGPVQGIVMKKLFGLTRAMVQYTDARVESTNEALQGIQCVKMYTWEDSVVETIDKSRSQELSQLKSAAYLRGFSRAYMGALPGVVAVISFVVYTLFFKGAEASASTLFAALVAFDQLRFPLLFYPMSLAQLIQAKVSAARVEVFLGLKEVGAKDAIGEGEYHRDEEAKGEIILSKAEVFWSDPKVAVEKPLDTHADSGDGSTTLASSVVTDGDLDDTVHSTKSSAEGSDLEEASTDGMVYPKASLKGITMKVSNGELCAVVGRVASGKSTLCSAVLNEAVLNSGSVTLSGKVAYAAQSPWILNATVRENILFGKPMDEERYSQVLRVCQLAHDLDILEDGDLTDIGERGINLSGGQKARVSVARAAYADADTIIFDDPLSALDPEVGNLLFSDCIVNFLAGKTRLLVTNQIQFLSSCDTVVALKKGEIVEQGRYTDLIADAKSEVNRLLSKTTTKKSKQTEVDSNKGSGEKKSEAPMALRQKKTLLTKEERNIGAVSWKVYKDYLKSGGGLLRFCCLYFGFVLSVGNSLATSSWISFWTSDAQYERHSEAFYLGIYFGLSILLGIVTFLRAYQLATFGIRASDVLHRNLLKSVFQAPMSFFDTTPLGRIISRFSKDIYTIDLEIADYLDFFLFCSLSVITSIATIIFVTPWFAVAAVPLAFFYLRFLNFFREVSRETKRLDSISRSPVYAHFSETLGGLATIRAYGQPTRFQLDFEEQINGNSRTYYNNKAADRWLSVRLEVIGSFIAGAAAVFSCAVVITAANKADSGISDNFASLAGLSLNFAIGATGMLQWCVRSFAQLENGMNATERILHYTEDIPQEAPFTADGLEKEAKGQPSSDPSTPSAVAVLGSAGQAEHPPAGWPQKGNIAFNNLKMKYREDTPLVLKGLNVSIAGGERVGVVGRTGSGKSSLLLTLLRLVEPSLDKGTYEAPISIDGVDILRVGLRDLRSKVGIIPQSPVLFSGTIRSNMDPFQEFSDDQIWEALLKCGLKAQVEAMSGGLGASVAEYGGNLSSGMCQMLVLGRALLKQCRILLLDEATSSVDFETDREIQRTLREAFTDCTILTIAHRIGTIMDSDKILVMKDGVAAEFAPPKELLADKDSLFSDIVRHAEAEDE